VEYVTCTGKGEMHTKFRLESLKGRDRSEDLGVDGTMVLTHSLSVLGVTEPPANLFLVLYCYFSISSSNVTYL
jgi:hypothetical protein